MLGSEYVPIRPVIRIGSPVSSRTSLIAQEVNDSPKSNVPPRWVYAPGEAPKLEKLGSEPEEPYSFFPHEGRSIIRLEAKLVSRRTINKNCKKADQRRRSGGYRKVQHRRKRNILDPNWDNGKRDAAIAPFLSLGKQPPGLKKHIAELREISA
jgi:hypothetical protein